MILRTHYAGVCSALQQVLRTARSRVNPKPKLNLIYAWKTFSPDRYYVCAIIQMLHQYFGAASFWDICGAIILCNLTHDWSGVWGKDTRTHVACIISPVSAFRRTWLQFILHFPHRIYSIDAFKWNTPCRHTHTHIFQTHLSVHTCWKCLHIRPHSCWRPHRSNFKCYKCKCSVTCAGTRVRDCLSVHIFMKVRASCRTPTKNLDDSCLRAPEISPEGVIIAQPNKAYGGVEREHLRYLMLTSRRQHAYICTCDYCVFVCVYL